MLQPPLPVVHPSKQTDQAFFGKIGAKPMTWSAVNRIF